MSPKCTGPPASWQRCWVSSSETSPSASNVFFGIVIDHPAAAFPDIALRSLYRSPCIAARSEPIAMIGEFRFKFRLQNLAQRFLDQAVCYRWDASVLTPPFGFGISTLRIAIGM